MYKMKNKTGNEHLGIIEFPVPVLKGNEEIIRSIRQKLYEPELFWNRRLWCKEEGQ